MTIAIIAIVALLVLLGFSMNATRTRDAEIQRLNNMLEDEVMFGESTSDRLADTQEALRAQREHSERWFNESMGVSNLLNLTVDSIPVSMFKTLNKKLAKGGYELTRYRNEEGKMDTRLAPIPVEEEVVDDEA